MKVQIYWSDPQILAIKELLYEEECSRSIHVAGAKLRNWENPSGNRGVPWNRIRVMKK